MTAQRVFGFVFYLLTAVSGFSQNIVAEKGHLDLSAHNFDYGSVDLDGQWEFYWQKLISPEEFKSYNLTPEYIRVPSVWNGKRVGGVDLDGQGHATYRLVIKNLNPTLPLSLSLPNVYTSYKLWVNGELISENGEVGTTKASSLPEWKPVIKPLALNGSTIEIVLQVSNFYHHRGGIHKSFAIGEYETVYKDREIRVVANMLLVGGLFVLGAFFIIFFLLRSTEKGVLFFGFFCALWAVRSLFSNLYLITALFDDIAWNTAIHIEYVSLYLSVLFGMLFLTNVFKVLENQLFKYIILTINYLFIALTLILPPIFFTTLLPAYQLLIGVNLIYAAVIIGKAIVQKHHHAWFSAMSIFIGMSMFIYELAAYVMVFNLNFIFLNIGYLAVFFLNSLVLAYSFVKAYDRIKVLEDEQSDFSYGKLGRI